MKKIDYQGITQLELPKPESETECPMCKGRGTVKDGTGQEAVCVQCGGVGKVKSSTLQSVFEVKESPETAAEFEKLESANTAAAGVPGEAQVAAEPPPRRRGRPSKASKEAEQKAILEQAKSNATVYSGGSRIQEEAEQRQKEFENDGTGVDTDNDCAP